MYGPFRPIPSPPPLPAGLVAHTPHIPKTYHLNFLPAIPPPLPPKPGLAHPPNAVVLKAYQFNGSGNFIERKWDIAQGRDAEFCWYHVQIDPKYVQLLQDDAYAHILIDALCPPLNLLDIVSLVNDGTFCSCRDGVLVFRINLSGHASGYFPFRIAARVSEKSLITVSLGDVPRLHYNKLDTNHLFKVPGLELSRLPNPLPPASYVFQLKDYNISTITVAPGKRVPTDHNLADLFSEARSLQIDSTVPRTMANLVVHVIDTHVDIIRTRIANIEKELNELEDSWVNGNLNHNKKLDDIKFREMPFKLQRVLQVIAQTEQGLHQVKEECRSIPWLNDVVNSSVMDILSRSQAREQVKILTNRVAAINRRMETIQSELIEMKASISGIIFLPFSIITGVYSMQVRGTPWSGNQHGCRNVLILIISTIALLFFLLYFCPAMYLRLTRGRKKIPPTSMA